MIALAWILLFAANPPVELFDDVIAIRPHEWREADLDLRERPGRLSVRFDNTTDGNRIKVSLIRREDLSRLWKGQPHEVLAAVAAAPAASGHLSYQVPAAGEYSVIVRSLSDSPTQVHLRILVNYPRVTTLSPERRVTVVLLSFAFFLGTVTFSARRLLKNIRR